MTKLRKSIVSFLFVVALFFSAFAIISFNANTMASADTTNNYYTAEKYTDTDYLLLDNGTESLTKTIKESVQDFKALLQNKNVIFDDSKDVLVNADLNMIKQLITIFLDNSIKYTPDNGTIEIKLEKLSKGKGTKMEFLNTCENPRSINTKKLFDRFYRGDKSRNKTKEGYGIGLSIAKSIVDIHKGKISAFITKDERICFRVII